MEIKLRPEHVNGYHGSSKDQCIYCGLGDAPEYKVCPVRAERDKKDHACKLRVIAKVKKALGRLSPGEAKAVVRFFDRSYRDLEAFQKFRTY